MDSLTDDFYEGQTFRGLVLDGQVLNGITFQDCTFNRCSFKEASFRSCKFLGCLFKKCDLNLMKVDHSSFKKTRFEGSKVIGVNWVKASWGRKEFHQLIKSIDFYQCVLNYSSFMGLTLEQILIQKCVAREVDFSDANLKQANCSYTDFENSQFRHTDLTGADFTGATNYFIKPDLNVIKKARFSLPEAMSLLYNLEIEISEALEDNLDDEDEPYPRRSE